LGERRYPLRFQPERPAQADSTNGVCFYSLSIPFSFPSPLSYDFRLSFSNILVWVLLPSCSLVVYPFWFVGKVGTFRPHDTPCFMFFNRFWYVFSLYPLFSFSPLGGTGHRQIVLHPSILPWAQPPGPFLIRRGGMSPACSPLFTLFRFRVGTQSAFLFLFVALRGLGFQGIARQPFPVVSANMTTPYLWDPFSFGGKVRCPRDRRDPS